MQRRHTGCLHGIPAFLSVSPIETTSLLQQWLIGLWNDLLECHQVEEVILSYLCGEGTSHPLALRAMSELH